MVIQCWIVRVVKRPEDFLRGYFGQLSQSAGTNQLIGQKIAAFQDEGTFFKMIKQ